jgi:beta-N-acetylhexosaminidase
VELTERSTMNEVELVRAMAPRYDAVVASVFVRAASGSGRMDLPANMQALLRALARQTEQSRKPFVTVLFGNPVHRDVPAGRAGDASDLRFLRSRRAIRRQGAGGEAPITGKLPIALPGVADRGAGLQRVPRTP